jgi:hypothetical protein
MRKALVVLIAICSLWLAPNAFASWCGSGETQTDRPDTTAGYQVHAVVMQPADAPDNFAADANRMADDVTSISNWWLGQDSTRVPRFDQSVFPGGTCLDISYVRLANPGASYVGASSTFNAVIGTLQSYVSLSSQYKDYLVYYDGPAPETGVCGIGGGTFNDDGWATVFLAGCTDVPADGIAAHELLHSLGALPEGAPNFCTPQTDPAQVTDSAHPCDLPTDVLYPYADTTPLAQKVLDFNHDDYYAHNGSWDDLQDSVYLHHTDAPPIPLALNVSGVGHVVSDVPGVDCAASCTTQWDKGSTVVLSPTASNNSRFVRWGGACAGEGTCVLDLAGATSATATFGPVTIPFRQGVTGKGSVVCRPGPCKRVLVAGNKLTLTATPSKGWKFLRWTGGCTGTRIVCTPKTDFALTVHAAFKRLPVTKAKKKR